MLSDVIAAFVKEKTSSGVWDERTVKEYPKKNGRLLDVMGDVAMNTVGHESARSYTVSSRQHLASLNGQSGKATSGRTSFTRCHCLSEESHTMRNPPSP